jgi:large conductance mechanosensitive channel
MFQDFKAFLTKSNALALAVGVIIGAAVGKVVTSLVDNLLMPIIGLILPGGAWREMKIVLKTNPDGTPAAALGIGPFLGTVVDFLIVAAVVFLITKALLKPVPEPPAPPTKTCPACKETVPADATRCRACTGAL